MQHHKEKSIPKEKQMHCVFIHRFVDCKSFSFFLTFLEKVRSFAESSLGCLIVQVKKTKKKMDT